MLILLLNAGTPQERIAWIECAQMSLRLPVRHHATRTLANAGLMELLA